MSTWQLQNLQLIILKVPVLKKLPSCYIMAKDQYVPAANMFIDRMSKAITLAKEHMYAAREQQSKYASGKARPHTFGAGQHVLLSSRYIRLRSDGTPKLQPKW